MGIRTAEQSPGSKDEMGAGTHHTSITAKGIIDVLVAVANADDIGISRAAIKKSAE